MGFWNRLFGGARENTNESNSRRVVEQVQQKVEKKKAKSVIVTPRLIKDTITALQGGLPKLQLAIRNRSNNDIRKIIPDLRGINKNIVAIDNYYKTKYSGDLAIIQAQGADAPPFLARDLKKEYQKLSKKYWILMDKY